MGENERDSKEQNAKMDIANRTHQSWLRVPLGILSAILSLFFGYFLLTFAIPKSYRQFSQGNLDLSIMYVNLTYFGFGTCSFGLIAFGLLRRRTSYTYMGLISLVVGVFLLLIRNVSF